MNIDLSTPALLFPAIAILILGYVNRYLGTANVIRTFKKDYDSGYKHTDIVTQINILRKRIDLSRYMISIATFALILACLSMYLIFANMPTAGNVAFGLSLLAMITSILTSLYETSLSNKSLLVEINHILGAENNRQD